MSPRPDRVPVRPDLVDVTPYGAPQLDVPIRLNTNETAEPPPPAFLATVAERIRGLELNRYPDRPATALRTALGDTVGLPVERVWAANGSNEVLLQLFQAYGGPTRRMLLFRPGYSAHPLIARVAATPVVEHDLPEDLVLTATVAAEAVDAHAPDLVVVASPHNPAGVALTLDAVRALHDGCDGLVVLDEAYVEFSDDPDASVRLLDELPRLVVTRTFSKAYRLAGLRLGYLLAHDWVVDDVRKVRLPYHLDALTQVAGLVALEQRPSLTTHLAETAAERDRIIGVLDGLSGVSRVWPSVANFVLFRVTEAGEVFDGLLGRGVLVRDFSTAPGLAGCLRVTVGTPAENDAFLGALGEVLSG
ncbi:MAG: histidinol-phosphate transaminase [Actinomycetes bacterium]